MKLSDLDASKKTGFHLIIEQSSDESLINFFAPSFKIKGFKGASTKHIQISRWVYSEYIDQEYYFEGKKMGKPPGFGDLIVELIKPGTQITTRNNTHRSIVLTYVGKKNIMQIDALQIWKKNVNIPFIDYLGEDPAKNCTLIGNPAALVIATAGNDPTAAAYYNSNNKQVQYLNFKDKNKLLAHFSQNCAEKAL